MSMSSVVLTHHGGQELPGLYKSLINRKANKLLAGFMYDKVDRTSLSFIFFLHGSMLFGHHKALARLYISFSVGLRQTGNLTRIARLI